MTHQIRSDAILAASNLQSGYREIPVLHDISLHLMPGEIVALLGRNGAGKSTTLLTLAGFLPPKAGEIWFRGKPCTAPAHRRAREGLAYVIEERGVFMGLTVAQNLRLGLGEPDRAFEFFPELTAHRNRPVGLLSGGQQQMLAVGRALAADPAALLIDELSLGLAPLITDRIMEALVAARNRGVGIILVEQHSRTALQFADRAYLLDQGKIMMSGTAAELSPRVEEIERAYLGAATPVGR